MRRESKWARRDADLAGIWFVSIVVALLWKPMLYVVVGLPLLVLGYVGVRELLRRRRWRREPESEFWADRIKE